MSVYAGVLPDASKATFQFYKLPLVSWIWIGFWIVLIGTIICLDSQQGALSICAHGGSGTCQQACDGGILSFSPRFLIVCLPGAQDPTSLLTPGVMRVGEQLACRCGIVPQYGTRIAPCCAAATRSRCGLASSDAGEWSHRATRSISTIVREQGVVALAAPPAEGWGLFTWVMPGVALLLGFLFIPGGCAATGGSHRRFPKWTAPF